MDIYASRFVVIMDTSSLQSLNLDDILLWETDPTLCHKCALMLSHVLPAWLEASKEQAQSDPSQSSPKAEYKALPSHVDSSVGSLLSASPHKCSLCSLLASEFHHLSPDHLYTICYQPGHVALLHIFTVLPEQITSKTPTSALGSRKRVAFIGLLSATSLPSPVGPAAMSSWRDMRYFWKGSDAFFYTNKLVDSGLHLIDGASLHEYQISRIQKWYDECLSTHDQCSAVRSQYQLPKRILDVSRSDGTVVLYISEGEMVPYIALSYCWGASLPLKTLRSNLEAHQHGIPLDSFPQTLQDAIRVTRALNLKYIWIDALCIIQDDDLDWAEQSAAMTDIYQGCALNICAAQSRDCNEGLLPKISSHSCVVADSSASKARKMLAIIGRPDPFPSTGILETRGWVFQETLVSLASLQYTGQGIEWFCCIKCYDRNGTLKRSWGQIHPVATQNVKQTWLKFLNMRQRLADSLVPDESHYRYIEKSRQPHFLCTQEENAHTWHDLISDFSRKELTRKSDKLAAVAGIATHFSDMLDSPYHAGIWKNHFLPGLTWQRSYLGHPLVRHRNRAPSWSWASVDGPINYPRVFSGQNNRNTSRAILDADVEIVGIDIKEHNPGNFGSLHPGGRLSVIGTVVPVEDLERDMVETGLFAPLHVKLDFILDETPDPAALTRPAWIVRLLKHKEYMRYPGHRSSGFCNFFLVLEGVAGCEDAFRRVGWAVCHLNSFKHDKRESGKDKAQAALDGILASCPRGAFTLV